MKIKNHSNIESVIALTEKKDTLAASLDAHFAATDVGHYFERLTYPGILILTLNWRLQKSRPLSQDIEILRSEHEAQYHAALEMLEKTGDLASFTCNISFTNIFPD